MLRWPRASLPAGAELLHALLATLARALRGDAGPERHPRAAANPASPARGRAGAGGYSYPAGASARCLVHCACRFRAGNQRPSPIPERLLHTPRHACTNGRIDGWTVDRANFRTNGRVRATNGRAGDERADGMDAHALTNSAKQPPPPHSHSHDIGPWFARLARRQGFYEITRSLHPAA